MTQPAALRRLASPRREHPAGGTGRRAAALLLRLACAALLAWIGYIHLHLWLEGYRQIPTDGPLFLADAVAGFALAAALLAWPRPLTGLAAAGYIASDIGALLISLTVGLFGFKESISAAYVVQTLTIETITLLALLTWTALAAATPGRQPAASAATRHPASHGDRDSRAAASLRPPSRRKAKLAHPRHVILHPGRGRQLPASHPVDVDLIDIAEPPARRAMSPPPARVSARAPEMRGDLLLIGDQAGDLHPEARERVPEGPDPLPRRPGKPAVGYLVQHLETFAIRRAGQIGGGGSGWRAGDVSGWGAPSTTSTALPDHVRLESWLQFIDTRLPGLWIPA
jgi:hypothetical protein